MTHPSVNLPAEERNSLPFVSAPHFNASNWEVPAVSDIASPATSVDDLSSYLGG